MIDELTFADTVHVVLGPTLERHGFQQGISESFRVRYEKGTSFVEVTYASGSHEVSIWLAESQPIYEPPLELSDALRVTGCPPEGIRFAELIQTSDSEALKRLLERVDALLRDWASEFLDGTREAYTAARARRSDRAAQYTRELQMARVLEDADVAWTEKDYRRVLELLQPISSSLDEVHRRRLAYAEQQMG
jgi:hypothetical protein